MRFVAFFVTVVVALALASVPIPRAAAQIPEGWEIVEIFPAGTEYYCGRPDINDRGQIVFHRRLWPSRNEIEIILYDRGRLVQLTDDDVYDAFPRINNVGDIVWSRDLDPDPIVERIGIVRWCSGKLDVFSDPGDDYWGEGSADINDFGQIVWQRLSRESGAELQIFLFEGNAITPLTDDALSNQSARINTNGDVVWTQYHFSASPWFSQIMGYLTGLVRQLSSGRQQIQGPHLNDFLQVVWTNSQTGVYIWDAGETQRIVTNNAINARINNRGAICMSRWDESNKEVGLWLLTDGKLSQITDGSFGGNIPEVNARSEITFESGGFPSYGIALLTKPSFRADLDFDGDADVKDFAILQACFGVSISGMAESCTSSDINNDGNVDSSDIREFVEWFGGPE